MRRKEQEAEKKLSRQGAEYKTLQRDFQRCTEHIEQLNAVAKKKQLQIARLKEAEGQLTDMKKRCREGEELIKKAQEREAALVEELAGLQNDNAFLHDSMSKQREMNEELEGKVGKITEMAKTRQEACQGAFRLFASRSGPQYISSISAHESKAVKRLSFRSCPHSWRIMRHCKRTSNSARSSWSMQRRF